jgi:hypothetical protein
MFRETVSQLPGLSVSAFYHNKKAQYGLNKKFITGFVFLFCSSHVLVLVFLRCIFPVAVCTGLL